MQLDFRMYLRFRNSADWETSLAKLNLQSIDRKRYTLLELADIFQNPEQAQVKEQQPVGKMFKDITADQAAGTYFAHDSTKSLYYYTSVVGYIFNNLAKNHPEDVVMVADVVDYGAREMGDIVFYYLGGRQMGQFRLNGEAGMELHESSIADIAAMMDSEKDKLTPEQQAKIEEVKTW